jgi:hypothetical protein
MPQLIDALRRHAHPKAASDTEPVGAAAYSSPWIVTQVPRDSGLLREGAGNSLNTSGEAFGVSPVPGVLWIVVCLGFGVGYGSVPPKRGRAGPLE